MTLHKVAFIGLGLIGGSIAKAIRQYYPDCELIAFDQNTETLAQALSKGILNAAASSINESFAHCDYIFLCTPVSHNNEYLNQLRPYLDSATTLTDVGSVKTSVHEEVSRLGLEEFFIGGHPMAGSEKTGFSNAKAWLIENAYYIVTPTASTSPKKLAAYQELAASLKAIPIVMDYRQHDQVTGTISHLPHIIASSLVGFVRDTDTEDELMKLLAAGGFKDITRIASSSPAMWQQICLENQENISRILEHYIVSLNHAKELVDAADAKGLYSFFDASRNYRNAMPEASAGPLKKSFSVYCDIIDETGGIAIIATILASNRISIKNIGILHNREFEEGVLRIEFYDQESSHKAALLLQKYRYVVYER